MNSNDLFQASHRCLLVQLGGLTVAGILGTSLLTPCRATAAQTVAEAVISKEGTLTGSYWEAIRATVKDGRFVAAKPFELDKYPSKMIVELPDCVHNAAHIRYPVARMGWLRERHLSNTSQRGDSHFVRVSWDEVLDTSYEELERVWKTHGPSALPTVSGWQLMGMSHNVSGALVRTIALYNDSAGTSGDYSTGAAQAISPRVIGSMEVYEQQISWPLILQNSKTTVLWGSDLLKNQQANWWCPDHDIYEYYERLRVKIAAGEIGVVSTDPAITSIHEHLGREYVRRIAANSQADVPLQLAPAHMLHNENPYDENFLANYCVGFEQFLPYLLSEKDGQPKDAAWTEKLTGIDAETTCGLVRQMVANRTQVIAG